MDRTLETFVDPTDLASTATEAVITQLKAGLDARGAATLVGTGGRSPGPIYDRLARAPLGWNRVTVTLSDERCVGSESPDSNARLIKDRLLVGGAAAARFLPLWPRPPEGTLTGLAPFDAVLLGMGEDGHVASLIPGDPHLVEGLDQNSSRWLADCPAGLGSPPLARVTLTLAALCQSRAIFLLIAGETKRQVIARALAGDDLPVRALLAQDRAPVRIFWSPN